MFPCASPSAWSVASAFCATVTTGGTTATDYPSRATAACGSAPDRYLSACSRGPTCTPSPTASPTPSPTPCIETLENNLISNGDFECGLDPWRVDVPDLAAHASLSTTTANTGSTAFQIRLTSSPANPEQGTSARIKTPVIPVIPGKAARLKFASFFDNLHAGFIGVKINGDAVYTVDAADKGIGDWHNNSVDYTPTNDTVEIEFDFVFEITQSVDLIDTVIFEYVRLA